MTCTRRAAGSLDLLNFDGGSRHGAMGFDALPTSCRGSDPGGPPDFDGDGNVGAEDRLVLLVNWGPCP
ncbi:MAG: hypothetical protein V3T84_12250 [Phycisphaerales bacterium]